MSNQSNKIGFWSVFSIVTSSQIGAGVFTLPACLAFYGIFGLLGCLVSGLGAIALSFVFAALCARLPYTGGPHVYVDFAFGEKIAFFTGWTYWVISWVSTTAVIVTSIGYLFPFLSRLFIRNIIFVNYYREICLILELVLLAMVALINLKGIKFAGVLEFILTILKFIPLIVLPMVALFYFDKNNIYVDQKIASWPNINILAKATLFSMWGFIGLETGTAPAGSVIRPRVTIPKAIILGTLSVLLLYMLNFVSIMGLIPGSKLIHSSAPYLDAAEKIFGGDWYLLITVITGVVLIGTLNAWVLTSAQISLGLAIDGFMPKFFKFKNQGNAPIYGIIISCVGIVPLLIITSLTTGSLSQQAMKIIDVSLVSFLFVYLICVISFLKLLIKEKNSSIHNYVFATLALVFCIWVIYETTPAILCIASLFTFSGVPVYLLWYCRKKHKKAEKLH